MKRLIAALIFVPSVAFAAPLDFTKELIGKDRQPFRECVEVDKVEKTKCVNEINVTLGWLTATALDIPKQGMSGAERTKRGRLAYKVMDASEVYDDMADPPRHSRTSLGVNVSLLTD